MGNVDFMLFLLFSFYDRVLWMQKWRFPLLRSKSNQSLFLFLFLNLYLLTVDFRLFDEHFASL